MPTQSWLYTCVVLVLAMCANAHLLSFGRDLMLEITAFILVRGISTPGVLNLALKVLHLFARVLNLVAGTRYLVLYRKHPIGNSHAENPTHIKSPYAEVNAPGTSIKAVFSGTKSPPNKSRCALAHRADIGTTHVYSHDRVGTSHRAPRSVRMEITVCVRYELVTAVATCSALTS